MKILLSLVLFLSSSSAFAFKLDADEFLKDIAWTTLMNKVIAEGTQSETGISQLRGIPHIQHIEKDKEYIASYLTTSGRMSMFGEYLVEQVSMTSEHWILMPDGKTWAVDQWFFYMTSKGDFTYAVRNTIEKEGVSVKKYEPAPIGPNEEVISRWRNELLLWLSL